MGVRRNVSREGQRRNFAYPFQVSATQMDTLKAFTIATPQWKRPIVTATVTKTALRCQQCFLFIHASFHKV